jgi:hypothetical protein
MVQNNLEVDGRVVLKIENARALDSAKTPNKEII